MKVIKKLFKKEDTKELRQKLDINKDGTVDYKDLQEVNERLFRSIDNLLKDRK